MIFSTLNTLHVLPLSYHPSCNYHVSDKFCIVGVTVLKTVTGASAKVLKSVPKEIVTVVRLAEVNLHCIQPLVCIFSNQHCAPHKVSRDFVRVSEPKITLKGRCSPHSSKFLKLENMTYRLLTYQG